MSVTTARKCARCGFLLVAAYQFCPGCALPTVGHDVLSTEIGAARHQAERRHRGTEVWKRVLYVGGLATMFAFVAGLGFVLFDKDMLDRVLEPPKEADFVEPSRREWEPEWKEIPANSFLSGDQADQPGAESSVDETFLISKYEVPNWLWEKFVIAQGPALREMQVYDDAIPGESSGWETGPDGAPRPTDVEHDRPVRNVTPLAAALFCEWLTTLLKDPEWEIRLPTRLEWEYAARGTNGYVYPWGNEFYIMPPGGGGGSAPKTRKNISTYPPATVFSVDDDTSPFGVVAMGTNVSEFAISSSRRPEKPDGSGLRSISELIEARLIIASVCGASFGNTPDKAEDLARTWRTNRDLEKYLRYNFVGLRLVKARKPKTGG